MTTKRISIDVWLHEEDPEARDKLTKIAGHEQVLPDGVSDGQITAIASAIGSHAAQAIGLAGLDNEKQERRRRDLEIADDITKRIEDRDQRRARTNSVGLAEANNGQATEASPVSGG